MHKSRKNNKKNRRKSISKRNVIRRKGTSKKCIYTDEAKRLIRAIEELRKTRKNKSRRNK